MSFREHIAPTVILIEDAHCVYEAQKSIAGILEKLIKDYDIKLVCVEGAAGNINYPLFSSFPDSPAKEKACDQFMRDGHLSGAEALAISKGKELPFTLWGSEDVSLYDQDLRQYQKAIKLTEGIEWFIRQSQNKLVKAAEQAFNSRLKEFSRKQTAFIAGELSADHWLNYLCGINPDPHCINFNLLIKTTRLEKLILAIGLADLHAVSGLLVQYINIRRQQPINMEQMFGEELPLIVEQAAAALIKTEEENEIYHQLQFINLLTKLLHLQINRQEIAAFLNYDFPFLIDQLTEGNDSLLAGVERAVNAVDEFYRLAHLREDALVKNTIKKMQKAGKNRAVLITGGFHTQGLRDKFQQQGINTLKITPQITAFQSNNPYHNVIMDSYLAPPLFSWRLYQRRPELVADLFRLMFVYAEKPLAELSARIADPLQKQLFQEFVNLAGSLRDSEAAELAVVLLPEDIIVTLAELEASGTMSPGEQETLFAYIFLCLRTRARLTDSSLLEQVKILYNLLPEDSRGISAQLRAKLEQKLETEPKVVLVNFSRGTLFRSVKPLGLARISANLKENNISTHIVDGAARQLKAAELAAQVAAQAEELSGPLVIGVSILPGDVEVLGEFLRKLPPELKSREDVYICAGGYLPTMAVAEFMVKFSRIDFIVRGEGELALVNLVKAIDSADSFSAVENLIYRDSDTGEIQQNPHHHVLTGEELSTLPEPDYSLLIGQDSRFLKKALIDTTRGCLGNCRFCGLRTFMDAKGSVTSEEVPATKLYWRSRSVNKVVDEIEALHVKYGITGFDFVDDDFIGNDPQRAMAIAQEIIARGLQGKISFWCLARAASVVKAVNTTILEQGPDCGKNALEILREAGLRMVFLGAESFDDEQLRFYRKGARAATNLRTIQALRDAGIETRIGFINFYRESTLAQIQKNIQAIDEHDLITAIPTPSAFLRVYKSTPLYDEYLREGVDLLPLGNDAFLCDIKRREVDFLFKKAKRIGDKSYRMMMHFKELQEQKYYFPSTVAERAEEVFRQLKELEFNCFQQLLELVTTGVAGLSEDVSDYDYQLDKRLESIDGQCSEIVQGYFQQMIDQVKIFNLNIGTVEDGYDAQYKLPNEKMFQDPIDRLNNALKAHGDAWVIFGDFLKLWNRNMTYDPVTVNYFIKKVADLADNVCRRYGGFAAHLMADEVILTLPRELAPHEVQAILEDIQRDIYEHFNGHYGFASIKIPQGADEEGVLSQVRELLAADKSFRSLTGEKLPVGTRDLEIEDRYCLLIDLREGEIGEVLTRLNALISDTGASLRPDVNVEIPWLPMGAVRAKHVPRRGKRNIRFWIDDILEQAEFVEERAKKENPQMIQVAGREDLVRAEEDEDSLFSAEEMSELAGEVNVARTFLRQRNYAVEGKFPAYKKSALGAIIGDTLYYGQTDVLLCRLDVGYELQDMDLLSRFEDIAKTHTRQPRKGEEDKKVYGFKSMQDVYGRKKGGDDVIFLLNLWLHRKFHLQGVSIVRIGPDKFYFVFARNDSGQFPSAEEISVRLAEARSEISKVLSSQLGVQVLFQLSLLEVPTPIGPESILAEIPKRQRDAYVGSAIKTINLVSDTRREQAEGDFLDVITAKFEEGTEIRDFNTHPEPEAIRRLLKEREAKSKRAMRRNSLGVLRSIREKHQPETVLQRTTPQPKPVIVVFGYPAAGKSTVLEALQQQDAEICQISIGDVMRSILDPNPEFVMLDNERMIFNVLGRQLREDEIQTGKALLMANNPPFPAWKRIFDRFLAENNLYLAVVVNLTVDRETAIARMEERARPGEASAEFRLANHERNVLPLVDYYRQAGYVIEFDNSTDDLPGLPGRVELLLQQLDARLEGGTRQYREVIDAEAFVNGLDYLELSHVETNQLTLVVADLIRRYRDGRITTEEVVADYPLELTPEQRTNLLRDATALVSLFTAGDGIVSMRGYLVDRIISLTKEGLYAAEQRLLKTEQEQPEYPLAPVYAGSCGTGEKRLNIARYHYRGRTYVRIGSRLYEADKTVDGLDAKDLLADPLLWLGNAELVDYYGEDQVGYPRQTTGPPGLRLVEWNEELRQAFPEIPLEDPALIEQAYQRLRDPDLDPLLRTHYSLIVYFFSITQNQEYTVRDLHIIANISDLHMNEFLYALLGTRQVAIPYIMSVQMRKLFRVLEKISDLLPGCQNIRSLPANIADPNLQNIILNRLHYALNGLRYQDIVDLSNLGEINDTFNDLLNRNKKRRERIELFAYDEESATLTINLEQLAVEHRDERERLDPHVFRKRGPPEVNRDKVIVTALAYLCQKEQAGLVNQVTDRLRHWPQSWAADTVLKGIDANYKVELETSQRDFLRDISFGAGRAVWVLGGGCAEQELWIRRIISDLFEKIKIMAGETKEGGPIINPNVDFGRRVQVPADCTALPSIDAYTWKKLRAELFSSDPISAEKRLHLQRRYNEAVWSTKVLLQEWIIEHDLRLLMFGQVALPEENPIFYPALLQAVEEVNALRGPQEQVKVIIRHNYTNKRKQIREGIKIRIMQRDDPVEIFVESETNADLFEENFGFRPTVVHQAAHFPNVNLDSDVPLREQVRAQEEFREPVASFGQKIELLNQQGARANAWLSFLLNIFFDTVDTLVSLPARFVKIKVLNDFISRIKYLAYSYKLKQQVDLENDIVIIQPSRIDANKMPESTVIMAKNMQQIENRQAIADGRKPRRVALLFIGTQIRTGDEAGNFKDTEQEALDNIWKTAKKKGRDDIDLRSQIHMLGQIPQEEVAAAYTFADIVSIPSGHETFGRVPFEAYAAPVIYTRRWFYSTFYDQSDEREDIQVQYGLYGGLPLFNLRPGKTENGRFRPGPVQPEAMEGEFPKLYLRMYELLQSPERREQLTREKYLLTRRSEFNLANTAKFLYYKFIAMFDHTGSRLRFVDKDFVPRRHEDSLDKIELRFAAEAV